MKKQLQKEDLREFYITPLYLKTIQKRAKKWSEDFIIKQLAYFEKTIPDYPEVHEILQTELHTRRLNQLHKNIRKLGKNELLKLLQKYKDEPDYCEIIQAELEIRSGANQLIDKTAKKTHRNSDARIV